MHRAGEILSELIVPDHNGINEAETSIELNLAVVKFKYAIKKKSKS